MNCRKILFLGTLLISLYSCRSLRDATMPQVPQLPRVFAEQSDSLSVSTVPRKIFFTDPALVALIDTAVQNNYDLQIATQRIETARASLLSARANYLPQVGGAATAGIDKYGNYTMNGVGNFDTNLSERLKQDQTIPNPTPDFFAGLRYSWEIGIWGKSRNFRRAAKARFLASENARKVVMTSLVAQVAQLYYQLLALDNEVAIIRKNIALQNKAVEVMDIMKQGARANELGVRQVHAQLLNTQALEFEKIQEITRTENQLNGLAGRYSGTITRGFPLQEQKLPATVQTGLPSTMLFRRPDLVQAEQELAAAGADVNLARAAFFPSINVTAYSGFNAFRTSLLFSNPGSLTYGLLSSLYLPIFQRNMVRSNFKRSKAEQRIAFLNYHKNITQSYLEVSTNLKGIENYKEVYELKKQEVEDLLNAVSVSNDLFVSGYATYLEVITAQKSVLSAEIELSEIKKNQFDYLIDLYRSLGGGWE